MRSSLIRAIRGESNAVPEIDPRELPALGPMRIIDVRDRDEFHGELGHIPGAELVPLTALASATHRWDAEETLVLVCRSGKRSADAVRQLREMGFSRALNLRGGMLLYRDAMRSS